MLLAVLDLAALSPASSADGRTGSENTNDDSPEGSGSAALGHHSRRLISEVNSTPSQGYGTT